MSDEKKKKRSEADAELEREILKERKFTLEEAIGRLIGPGGMKGESPVARMQQAEMEIEIWLRDRLADAGGPLKVVLHRQFRASEVLLHNFEKPLDALASYCKSVLASDYLLSELTRETDCEWGRVMDERPFFEREGSTPNPEDPYTIDSVRNALCKILTALEVGET